MKIVGSIKTFIGTRLIDCIMIRDGKNYPQWEMFMDCSVSNRYCFQRATESYGESAFTRIEIVDLEEIILPENNVSWVWKKGEQRETYYDRNGVSCSVF